MKDIRTISAHLARHAEDVCGHYLSNGRKHGRYWIVGDVFNAPGRSLFVRLTGPDSGPGAAGKWTDAATGEHGDLIDLIRINCGLSSWRDIRDEALAFLAEPLVKQRPSLKPALRGSREAARRLFASAKPVTGTPAETYLRGRGITTPLRLPSLHFHPSCFHRPHGATNTERHPALLAGITDLAGELTAVMRIYLAANGCGKAAIDEPRRALGDVLGHAVRFGTCGDALAVGEGVETMLALRSLLPAMPMNAALSANHLTALLLPGGLQRAYIAHDNDGPGRRAAEHLRLRTDSACQVRMLTPRCDDWNTDLLRDGPGGALATLLPQLLAEDRSCAAGFTEVSS